MSASVSFSQKEFNPRNAEVRINGTPILVTSFELKTSVDNDFTTIKIEGIAEDIELSVDDVRCQDIEVKGGVFVFKAGDTFKKELEQGAV